MCIYTKPNEHFQEINSTYSMRLKTKLCYITSDDIIPVCNIVQPTEHVPLIFLTILGLIYTMQRNSLDAREKPQIFRVKPETRN